MSHKTIITVDGESRSLLTYHHNYYRQKQKMKSFDTQSFFNTPIACDLRNGYRLDDFEHFSEPLPHILGGMFYVSFESTANDDLFYYWMKDSEVLNGSIEFYNTLDEDDIPFQRIDFWDAFLVRIKEQTTQGAFPMIMECDISAAIVRHNRNNATLHRKSWHFTDIDEKPIGGNNEAVEEEEDIERLLIRQVEGGKEAKPGEVIKYKVTQYNQDTATDNDKQSIRWAVRLGDGNEISLPESEYKGEEIELKIKDEWAGKEILIMPYLSKPWDKVAQKTKVSLIESTIIVYVNGYWNGNLPYAGLDAHSKYWGVMLKKAFNKYYNTSKEFFIDGADTMFSSGEKRYGKGVEYVKSRLNNEQSKFYQLANNSNIVIVSHSMGSAFAEGMVTQMIAQGITVKEVIHLSPADNSNFKVASPDITYQIDIFPDPVLMFKNLNDIKRIKGVKKACVVKNPHNDQYGHMHTKVDGTVIDWIIDLKSIAFKYEKVIEEYLTPIEKVYPTVMVTLYSIEKLIKNTQFKSVYIDGAIYYHYKGNFYKR